MTHESTNSSQARTATPTLNAQASPQSEELFALIVEQVRDFAIFAIDLDGIVASWNPGVERLLGYTEAEFIGQNACIIFTPEDNANDACAEEMSKAGRDGRAEDERWHIRKDGTRFWASGLMMRLNDAAGNLRGYSKVMRDQTAQKLAEEASREQERSFAVLVESLPDIISRFDSSLRCTYTSLAGERATGLPREQILGKTHTEMGLPPEFCNKADTALRRVFDNNRKESIEFALPSPDGVRHFEAYAVPETVHNDKVETVITVSREVTKRKRAEKERARLQQEIADVQTQRLAELSAPLLPLGRDTLLMPLVGTLDEQRAAQVLAVVSDGVRKHNARIVLVDITGVSSIDERVAGVLVEVAQTVYLLGAEAVLTGIRAQVAQALGRLGVDLTNLVTRKSLQDGMDYAGSRLRANALVATP